MIWFFLSLIAFVYFFAHSLIMEKIETSFYWNKGLIPPWAKKSEQARLYIYVALAGLLLKKDESVKQYPKLNSLYRFIIQNKRGRLSLSERDSYYSKLRNMLTYALAHPIRLEAVEKWFQQKLASESGKLQVLRYLVDFAHTGEIDARKRKVLDQIAQSLSLSQAQLEYLIENQKETERKEKQDRQKKGRTGSKTAEHARCCVVLGVKADADMDEIKKAFRKLVKRCHPDRFENTSAEEYKAAQQKFIEIQQAYETLEQMMSGK